MRYCLPICVVCVSSHLGKFSFGKFCQKVGIRSDPPLVGPKDQLFPFFLRLPLHQFWTESSISRLKSGWLKQPRAGTQEKIIIITTFIIYDYDYHNHHANIIVGYFFTQYQKENCVAANHSCSSSKSCAVIGCLAVLFLVLKLGRAS